MFKNKGSKMKTMDKESIVHEAVESVCQMMAVAAITAPKAKGMNFVEVKVLISSEELKVLSEAMDAYGQKMDKKGLIRDSRNVAKSDAVVLIGLKSAATAGLNCGACGYDLCDELTAAARARGEFEGPICAHRILDMGIAMGSAAKTASLFNVDSRIMYSIGAAARQMKLVDWEFVLGIPVSVSGKSIYFDR
jgi:uncharacterized ferredoxin-like protein